MAGKLLLRGQILMRKNRNRVLCIVLICLLCICGCGSGDLTGELSVDDVYSLLGQERDKVHDRLGVGNDDFEFQYSEEEDPYHQSEILIDDKTIEGKTGLTILHFDEEGVLDQLLFHLTVDETSTMSDYWHLGVRVSNKLDEKWKDESEPTGSAFDTGEEPDFSQIITKTRRWKIDEEKSYSFTWVTDTVRPGDSCTLVFGE